MRVTRSLSEFPMGVDSGSYAANQMGWSEPPPTISPLIGGDDKPNPELFGRTMMAKKKVGIVGKWFLAFNQEGRLDLQGRILEKMKDGIYLIETYGWSDGEIHDERIISVDHMCNWRFYPDFETFGLRAQQYLKSEEGIN